MKFKSPTFVLLSPLLLYAILPVPYCFAFELLIRNWFHCGCYEGFNANHFSLIFWAFISVCVTVISVFTSKVINKDKRWHKILYIAGVFATSVLISYLCANIIIAR